MIKRRSISVNVDVYLDEFDDVELINEVRERGYAVIAPAAKLSILRKVDKRKCEVTEDRPPAFQDELEAIRAAIKSGRHLDAFAMIDRLIAPKFKDVVACGDAYSARNQFPRAPA